MLYFNRCIKIIFLSSGSLQTPRHSACTMGIWSVLLRFNINPRIYKKPSSYQLLIAREYHCENLNLNLVILHPHHNSVSISRRDAYPFSGRGMLVCWSFWFPWKFTLAHLYCWLERDTARVGCLAKLTTQWANHGCICCTLSQSAAHSATVFPKLSILYLNTIAKRIFGKNSS